MRVAVLGPRGTFSELAALEHFEKAEFFYCQTITDVVRSVAEGVVDRGVIPVESLREGSVGEALDALAWMDVKVEAEIVLSVQLALLGVPGSSVEQIRQVLSHPQALSQARNFISSRLPNAELIEMTSTARAAEQVAKLQQPHMAAIGPARLANLYRLVVLESNISGDEENLTRFFCLGKSDSPPSGRDKTSIVFYTERDRPGILYEILGEFATRKINLTKIESRPSKKALGDYLFFIDFEGHRSDPVVREALEGVRRKTAMLKILGSYPRKY
jgi:prephenate dehydratase